MSANSPFSSRPTTGSQELAAGRNFLSPASAVYPQELNNQSFESVDRPGTRCTSRSARSNDKDDNRSIDTDGQAKGSLKSLFSTRIPMLRKNRSGSTKESPEMETANFSKDRTGRLSPFDGPFGSAPNDSRFGVQVSITGGGEKLRKSSFAEKAAKFGRETFGTEARPPWKGASGRTALVDPVRDTVQPRLPGQYTAVKNTSDMSLAGSCISHSSSESSLNPHNSQPSNVRETVASSVYDDRETVKPVLPLNIIKKEPEAPAPQLPPFSRPKEMSPIEPTPTWSESHEEAPSRHSTDSNRTVTGPDNQQLQSHFSWSTYAETERSTSPLGRIMSGQERLFNENELESRFSWTTASTDATYQQDTPPSSPPTVSESSSIMSRRRPVPGRDIVLPKRHDSLRNMEKTRKSGRDKTLPELPKAQQERNHMEELMARVESLEMQERNMKKLLADMEKIELASPIDVSERQRRDNRKKMAEVRTRQDEVKSKLVEAGRLLSRARAKAEEQDGSGSGLWLRRVTD